MARLGGTYVLFAVVLPQSLWASMDGCNDDPDGILAAEGSTCESKFGSWGPVENWCENDDDDYNGYQVDHLYQLCPKKCNRCQDYKRPVCKSDQCCCEAPKKPCTSISKATVDRLAKHGLVVVTCQEMREKRRLKGLDPGPPCPSGEHEKARSSASSGRVRAASELDPVKQVRSLAKAMKTKSQKPFKFKNPFARIPVPPQTVPDNFI